MDWILFLHFVGIIIGLGAVTVIDTMGFFSRKDKKKTQETIAAHHTTKPLIWLGTIIVLITWIILSFNQELVGVNLWKSLLLLIMVINGSFLSFSISPALDKLIGKNILLPPGLQIKIAISLIVSFVSWWSFVALSISLLS
ncbi:MAG: hypothetical protein NUV46_00260 [Nanoarchaeota archaeon]|nr:hypothetical protein [Nanoarchaeota archaeon]